MLAVDKETFQSEVLETEGYVLVDYWNEGCGPCKALMPDIEEISKQFESKIKCVKINTSQSRRLAISQRILGLPTISLYKNGQKVDEVTKDDATKANITDMILRYLK